jgi:hypothetical protein
MNSLFRNYSKRLFLIANSKLFYEEDVRMSQAAEQLKNADMRDITAAKNSTKRLARYGIQLAMLNKLLSSKLMTDKEYHKVSEQLRNDYRIASA